MRNKNCRNIRSQKGFAIVAIIAFALIIFAMLMATFPLILNVLRTEGTGRSMTELRSAAESGIDYAIQTLNDNCANYPNQACTIDLGTTIVPLASLGGFGPGTVKIRLSQLTSQEWQNVGKLSTLYSKSLDNSIPPAAGYPQLITQDYWRILECTAQKGVLSKSIKVFLEPRFDILPNDDIANSGPSSSISYFKNAFLGANSISIQPTDSAGLDISNLGAVQGIPSSPLVATSNTSAILDGSIGPVTLQSPIDLLNGATPVQIGQATYTPSTPQATPLQTPPPAPNAGSEAVLPTGTSGGTIPGGSYTTASVSFNGNENSAIIQDPVKIYVHDGADTNLNPDAVSVSSSALKNLSIEAADGTGGAANLQIWYDGQRDIKINLDSPATFQSLIYAPNAKVTISGTGDFKGAIVAKDIALNHSGNFFVDTRIQNAGSKAATANGLNYVGATNGSGIPLVLHGYKAVTWKEYSGSLIP